MKKLLLNKLGEDYMQNQNVIPTPIIFSGLIGSNEDEMLNLNGVLTLNSFNGLLF